MFIASLILMAVGISFFLYVIINPDSPFARYHFGIINGSILTLIFGQTAFYLYKQC